MQYKAILIISVLFYFIFPSHSAFGQGAENLGDRKSYFTRNQISDADKLRVFNNLWETVNRLYFDPSFNGVDWSGKREIYRLHVLAAKDKFELKAVLNKLLGELKTSHLNVSFEISMRGKTLDQIFGEKVDYKNNELLFGYGYSTAKLDNQLVVTEVQKNSSAEQTGIKPGWIQKSCQYHPLPKKNGDSLVFTESADCLFATETEAAKAVTVSQSWFLSPRSNTQRISKTLAGDILYLKFKAFDKGSGKWLKQQIAANSSAKAVIVDLRGNHGGLVNEVEDSLSVFFPSKTVIGEFIERDLDEKTVRVGSDDAYTGQTVVLIDGESYSAAEIFAAAFQELARGKIIGQRSGGQVLNSIDKSLSNDFNLRLPFRDYKTVKGERLEEKGVKPNIEVPFSIEDFRRQHDLVLEKTLVILKN